MDVVSYILDNKLILIPVLYVINYIVKKTKVIGDKFLPLVLLVVGILLSVLMGGDTIINNIVQGILVTGTTVLTDQIVVQAKNKTT